jgi:hypothetical protein
LLPVVSGVSVACLVAGALLVASGCGSSDKRGIEMPMSRYTNLPAVKIPEFMQGTVYERAELANAEPFAVSGYGLVVNLRGTGNSNAPTAVRDYMLREMVKHGIGTHRIAGYEKVQPEEMLRDPRVAIVRVDGYIPPGAREGQMFDVQVSALEQSYTTSLAHGQLFATDLRVNGANEIKPGPAVNVLAAASGPVFVNPAYALTTTPRRGSQRSSLRYGVVLEGGIVAQDMALALRLRQPEYRVARAIEGRVDERFQAVADKPKKTAQNEVGVAAAADDGIVHLYVPRKAYNGDWEHFSQVVLHLYMNGSPDFAAVKARQLAAEAVKPDARLLDITYCWEGLGPEALPAILPLMTNEKPEVAFAAARAAACIEDPSGSADAALANMARTPNHPFQVNAVQTLGQLPPTSARKAMLRKLLDGDQTLVRLEAYRILAREGDAAVFSKTIQQKFVLDVVPCSGPALVYASRQGMPRIALLGSQVSLAQPLMFAAMDSRLSMSSGADGKAVTIFYRPVLTGRSVGPTSLEVRSGGDLNEVIARLGGDGAADEEERLDFSYSDVVAIVQSLSQERKLAAAGSAAANGQAVPVPFVLQELPETQDSIYNAPVIPDRARPQDTGSAASGTQHVDVGEKTPSVTSPDLPPSGEDSGKDVGAAAAGEKAEPAAQ